MFCPRCGGRIKPTVVGQPVDKNQGPYRSLVSPTLDGQIAVELDTCAQCGGTWFDADETHTLARIKELSLSWATEYQAIDMEAYLLLSCPRCLVKMTKVRSLTNRKVYYDVCTRCRGMWFDAKELYLLLVGT